MRRVAGVIVSALVLAGCGGAATPSPSVVAAMASPTPTLEPTASPTASPTPAPTPTATPTPTGPPLVATDDVNHAIAIAGIPEAWMWMSSADIATEGTFEAWVAAHPAVTADSARTLRQTMSTSGVALLAFDTAGGVDGFTPNLNVLWVDAPSNDLEAWLADQAQQVEKEYGLDNPYSYEIVRSAASGGLDGYAGSYTWTTQERSLAGVQMVAPVDGRLALLTFTCLSTQTDRYAPIVKAMFTTLRSR